MEGSILSEDAIVAIARMVIRDVVPDEMVIRKLFKPRAWPAHLEPPCWNFEMYFLGTEELVADFQVKHTDDLNSILAQMKTSISQVAKQYGTEH